MSEYLRYNRTSIARTSLGPWKFVLDMGSSSHRELIIAPDEETNGYNLGMYFRSSIKYEFGLLSVLIRITWMRQS